MPKLGLILAAPIEGGIQQQVDDNFTRLENVFQAVIDTVVGTAVVTGTASINTGLAVVSGALGGLLVAPSAAACFVSVVPGSGQIIVINVYTNTFALSATPVTVQWVAFGELVLS